MTDFAIQPTNDLADDPPPVRAANFQFAPDASRALRLDRDVRAGLADSLLNVVESLEPPLSADEPRVATLLSFVKSGPVPPRLFGVYVELVLALFDDDVDQRPILDELLAFPIARPEAFRIVTLDDKDLGDGQAARYRRLLNDDVAKAVGPLGADALIPAVRRLQDAMDLLRTGAVDVFEEFRALVREIVLITQREGPEETILGGSSTFSLWGAMFLNADLMGERLRTALSIAHETAHTHLFGLAQGGRLVTNDDVERYPSPLRRDLRPMEGVAHATYVVARMIHALTLLAESGDLNVAETASARDQLRANRQAFKRGLATVTANARFTAAGAAAFDDLRRHMGAPG